METKIIDKIALLFRASKKKYKRVKDKYSTDFIYDFKIEQAEFFNDNPSGLRWLITLYISWKKNGTLPEEVKSNIYLGSYESYQNYVKSVFGLQHKFISEFKEAMEMYFQDPEKSKDLIERLDEGVELNREQFLLAVELYYIFIYEIIELYVNDNFLEYKTLLINPLPEIKNSTKVGVNIRPEVTKIQMRDLCDEQIKKLYIGLLKEKFIDERTSYISFRRILIPKGIKDEDKIIWIDIADNKMVNKVTLLEFVSLLIDEKSVQNKFIINYCKIYSLKEGEKTIPRTSLQNSRRHFENKIEKNSKREKIRGLIANVLM
ncbi:hypothetical protein [Pseudopedobacter beijingensis]|uniref:Uncharacterized protein n=1 Tax=Pseudopedobacter beijingensis TaxID=1207056 RepID=A0ABW4IFA3_9SPHI